jgi:integrase
MIVRTWESVVKLYLNDRRIEWEKATYASYKGVLTMFFRDDGLGPRNVNLDETREAVSEFFTILSFRMKRGEIRPTTYNNYLRHLKAFFNWCVAEA